MFCLRLSDALKMLQIIGLTILRFLCFQSVQLLPFFDFRAFNYQLSLISEHSIISFFALEGSIISFLCFQSVQLLVFSAFRAFNYQLFLLSERSIFSFLCIRAFNHQLSLLSERSIISFLCVHSVQLLAFFAFRAFNYQLSLLFSLKKISVCQNSKQFLNQIKRNEISSFFYNVLQIILKIGQMFSTSTKKDVLPKNVFNFEKFRKRT